MSAKRDKNCDILLQCIHVLHALPYVQDLKHKLYGFEVNCKPSAEKEVLFFPAGYDSMKKIQVDFENQSLTKDPDEPYEEVIKIPKMLVHSVVNLEAVLIVQVNEDDPAILAEDDQEFLQRLKEIAEKEPGRKDSGSKPNLLNSLRKFGALGN